MDRSTNEWAPITDADLLEPEEVEAPAPVRQEVEAEAEPAESTPRLPTIFPPRPKPIYTYEDWRVFGHWVRQKGFSIDMAAQCAGISVYDALVALQERDPWFYEFMVMVSPQGKGSLATRRRRGHHDNIGGKVKNYERTERHYQSRGESRQGDRRMTEDEARARFLALMGKAHPEDRVDGVRDHNRRLNAVHPETGRKRHQTPFKRVKFTSPQNGKDLRESKNVPAGSNSPTEVSPEGYEGLAAEEEGS